jgi:hypothetical protein
MLLETQGKLPHHQLQVQAQASRNHHLLKEGKRRGNGRGLVGLVIGVRSE